MKSMIVICFLLSSSIVSGRLLLYSDNIFIGCLDCISTIPDSVCNFHGPYGKLTSLKSIWNHKSEYGNPDSPSSPWSGSTRGPIMMDENGTVFGWFQINSEGGYTQSKKLNDLYKSVNGDLIQVRSLFCKD